MCGYGRFNVVLMKLSPISNKKATNPYDVVFRDISEWDDDDEEDWDDDEFVDEDQPY